MKYIIATAFFYLTVINLSAQITLTSTYNPVLGDKYTSYVLSGSKSAQAAGAAQKWDFSSLVQDSAYQNYADNVPSGKKSLYPYASLMLRSNYGDSTYYQTENTQFVNWGFNSKLLGITRYTDGEIVLKYPLTYADAYTDKFSGVSSAKYSGIVVPSIRSAIVQVNADGYGSLKLPASKFYPEVLRVKTVINAVDSLDKNYGSIPISSTLTYYTWYAKDINYPVLNILYVSIFNGDVKDTIMIQSGPFDATASVNDPKFADFVKISPNPFYDHLNVQIDPDFLETVQGIILKDVFGKEIKRMKAEENLSFSSLPILPGIYFLEITHEGGVMIKKILKQ